MCPERRDPLLSFRVSRSPRKPVDRNPELRPNRNLGSHSRIAHTKAPEDSYSSITMVTTRAKGGIDDVHDEVSYFSSPFLLLMHHTSRCCETA